MQLQDFLTQWIAAESVSTADVLASFLPLVREVLNTHHAGRVAPLEGLNELRVEVNRIWYEEAKRQPPRSNPSEIARIEAQSRARVEILAEARRTTDTGDGAETLVRSEIADRGAPITRPVYLSGYVTWEHELQHHDALTDVFSLGMLLAGLACQLDLTLPEQLAAFVAHRRNLFALNSALHPVLAQAIMRMTELDRHRRAQDLRAILHSLENYRDQTIAFELDLARIPGFRTRDTSTRRQVLLTRLRERLFDVSRRNNLLHYRPTMQSVNLTQGSIPLLLDIRNIRDDQILVWNDGLQQQIADGSSISLNKHLNFNEALYLPSLLERIIADARRDQTEYGFAQLRLVICFLSWSNLKEKPAEQFVSPLVLLSVKLTKNKGVRDTFSLEALTSEAEINPILRHQFKKLYDIDLPETIDLATTKVEALFDLLTRQIQASEPAVTLTMLDRPRIDLIHDKARRRLDQYRRSAQISGRGVRRFGDMDYSYDPANYHPLGVKLFSALVRTPDSHLRAIIEEKPRPQHYAVAPEDDSAKVVETERSFFSLRDSVEENPYLWNFDLCNLTLANFRYRRMSLVRDYESMLQTGLTNAAFDATFSTEPRPLMSQLTAAPAIQERFDVVPCDPTQAMAIAEARRGSNYIIQGPPGTGKSQTITNLIADFIARGKRVLFVCEKRAAIDVVFARLRQCGLGSLCSRIHDSQTDKREFVQDLKQIYEHFLPENTTSKQNKSSLDAATARLQTHLKPLEAFEGAMEAEVAGTGLSARRLLDRCIALNPIRPRLTAEETERLPHYKDWYPHAERLAHLERAVLDVEPSGVLARHPLRRLLPALADTECPIERVTTMAGQALEWLDRMTRSLRAAGVAADQWNTLARAEQYFAYLKRAAPIAGGGNFELADPTSDRSRRFAVGMERVRQATAALLAATQDAAAWRLKLSLADLRTACEQVRVMESRLLSFLSPAWWRMRGLLRRSYDFQSHAVRPTWGQVLASLQREYDAQAALDHAAAEVRAEFGLCEDAMPFVDQLNALRELAQRLPPWLQRTHMDLVKSLQAEAMIASALQADAFAGRLARALAEIVIDVHELSIDELRQELVAITQQARQVPQLLSVLGELERLPAQIGAALREMPLTVPEAEAATVHRTWEDLLLHKRDVARFDGRARAQYARQVETSYDAWLNANADEIRERIRAHFQDNVHRSTLAASQLSPEQREFKRRYAAGRRTLEHEFGKSMRYRAIRELVDGDAALVIQDLKPVWLMSPLSVSDTLPLPTSLFDVVIFDEASQIPLEESVPTLFRGQQVIIVGDEMQLPPTDFFASKSPAEDEGAAAVEEEASGNYDLDSDSLLNHAARNLPATMLGWHYRSRSESLISFSNWAFYDGRLLTVPDCQTPSGSGDAKTAEAIAPLERLLSRAVSFHLCKGAVYENRRNRAEAQQIAELVRGILLRRSGLSIGVIAFSEAQQSEIESALNRLAQDDDEFRALYEAERDREEDGQFVGLLVKNLENIQGDERDLVILSVCYGPGPQGKMQMNFGPINKTGGEKRLNVAFSRAKHHMAIVSSIQHTAITNDYNDGANCLKNYLRYAEILSQGDAEGAQRVLAAISRWRDLSSKQAADLDDPCCDQLAAALTTCGYIVERAVGQSHFRVDLAVRRASDSTHRLGILVDTATQYEQSDALEREMMRPRLLRAFGWRLTKVLAKDWQADPARELERVLALIEDAEPPTDEIDEAPDIDEADDVEQAPLDTIPIAHAAIVETATNAADRGVETTIGTTTNSSSTTSGQPPATRSADPTPAASPATAALRYFEFRDQKSNKFWEITLAGNQHRVRFGRLGAAGQSQTKIFDNDRAATRDAERLIREKLSKGYVETRPPG